MKTINRMALFMGTGMFLVTLSFSTASAQDKSFGKAWDVKAEGAKLKNPVKSDDASIAAGKDLFSQHCKSCHGAKGAGDGAKAEKLEIKMQDFSSKVVQDLTDGELYFKTTEGRKPMPAFKEKLSDTERWQVVAYMRTLKKN